MRQSVSARYKDDQVTDLFVSVAFQNRREVDDACLLGWSVSIGSSTCAWCKAAACKALAVKR